MTSHPRNLYRMLVLSLLCCSAPALAAPILQAEKSDVVTLAPIRPHWVLVQTAPGGRTIYDGDSGKILGTVPANALGNVTVAPDLKYFYVAETMWSEDTRGVRQDLFAIYDLSYPWKQGGFSSLCGDGSLVNLAIDKTGKVAVSHSKPFFDANNDPVFEASIDDTKSGEAFFISYSGKVYPAKLGPVPAIGQSWSLQQAAGQPMADLGVQSLAWRPGGNEIAAYHRVSRKLFVLMHTGTYWTQKEAGKEVWVFDSVKHKLLQRIALEKTAKSIAVSQDTVPQLYAITGTGDLAVIDAVSGKPLRSVSFSGGGALVTVPTF
jgi:hypothetical protein